MESGRRAPKAGRYAFTMMFVKDVATSMRFYSEAFGLKPKYVDERRKWAEMDTGSTVLCFTPIDQRDSHIVGGVQEHDASFPPVNVVIGIAFEGEEEKIEGLEGDMVRRGTVERAYKHAVDVGAVPVQAPELKPWGQFVGYVRDPDGVLVQLSSDPSAKSPLAGHR